MLINRHSTIFFLGVILAGTLYSGFTAGWTVLHLLGAVVVVGAAVALVRYAQRTATPNIPTVLRGGVPVLVEFYSAY